jgi:SAM-dependent methyltransferase
MPYCVICEQRIEAWLPHPNPELSGPFIELLQVVGSDLVNHLCPACNCNDRERHLWLYLRGLGMLGRVPQSRVLHVAPEYAVERRLRALQPREYVAGDLMPRQHAHVRVDVERLTFGDGAFDLIVCNHVLEHVEDPSRAVAEFARCLAPGGYLIAQTPYAPGLKHTFEMDGKVPTQFAVMFYGQDDHVRLFGRDILDVFLAAGLEGGLVPHREALPGVDPAEFGCNEREPFFLFRRPAVAPQS